MTRNSIVTFIMLLIISLTGFAQPGSIDADIIVAQDGSGDFTKIQDAINAVESNSDRQTIIYIKRGLYSTEKIIVPAEKKNVYLIGESRDETIISYHIYDCPDGKCPTEDAALWSGENIRTSATLTIIGNGFRAENLTIENTAGPVGQAQAITVRADRVVFFNCNLTGYQDTIYFWSDGKRCYMENCLVVGRTDYIYGGGIAFFQSCEIRSWGGGWITAPSTNREFDYGFVFHECQLTYAANSPRAGDDGALVRFGRPWHEYPKVAWLYCEMTEKIHPEGWGDTWNMEYAATSTDLHLYEYGNSGAGADMSGRANWAGLRALTAEEASNYTVQNVLGGNDKWDPTAEAPLITTYEWTGAGTSNGWMDAANWGTETTPTTGEAAVVDDNYIVDADGGDFLADLNLKNSAKLNIIANSSANYLATYGTEIQAATTASFDGKITTKDTIVFNITGTLSLDAQLTGVHELIKKGTGKLILNEDNTSFSGAIRVDNGELDAAVANSLGKGKVSVQSGSTLTISNNTALQPTSKLLVEAGATLKLNADITTSEFYIDGVIQEVGTYTAATNPGLITGTGQIIIGRPSEFTFIGGANGNWDNPAHFVPALMPEAGETVNVSIEMETTSTVFEADIHLMSPGNMRLRGEHSSTGTITMEEGTYFTYSTGGTGFTLSAPITLAGDVKMTMASGNSSGSSMVLGGSITGEHTVTVINNGRGTVNSGTVVLRGDNIGFSGVWDLTSPSERYPNDNSYITAIDGQSANAFGQGLIAAGLDNKIIFSHVDAVGDDINVELTGSARVVLNVDMNVKSLKVNDQNFGQGTYSATTNPEYFEGTGSITVSWPVGTNEIQQTNRIELLKNSILIHGDKSEVTVYSVLGSPVMNIKNKNTISLNGLKKGIYIIQYSIDGNSGTMKFSK
ncbi:pectinesterase family protein [Sunxiuqinia indica]|uniref:pectinesterase family protein n=1 Tax=Sunxiuqinia indica TaxID=2692584 RepID=UPI0013585750|nr:pectinesterase family protein [Sunxiuqinia indica]